jgi:hypothetical protein
VKYVIGKGKRIMVLRSVKCRSKEILPNFCVPHLIVLAP